MDLINLDDESWVLYKSAYIEHHDEILEILTKKLPLKQETLNFGGKDINMPRLVSWHGDEKAEYTYSRKKFKPNPWTKELLDIRDKLMQDFDFLFNSVLINFYRDGTDSIGWHSDSEDDLEEDYAIASVSLGASRDFILKKKADTKCKLIFPLGEGDLFIMGGKTQTNWMHGINKTTKKIGPRMNLTYRTVRV